MFGKLQTNILPARQSKGILYLHCDRMMKRGDLGFNYM